MTASCFEEDDEEQNSKKLKAKLIQAKSLKERERLIQKINKISVFPAQDIPIE